METPRYKLDFELDGFYSIEEDLEIETFDNSRIILHKSKVVNKGSVIYEADTLDQTIAKKEGEARVNHFLNCFLVTSNRDIIPLTFSGLPTLLNSEKFKDMPKTISKKHTISTGIVGRFPIAHAESAVSLMEKITKLDGRTQTAIYKCLSWFRKGAETGKDERFIYRWISLEALLMAPKQEYSSTQKMLSVLVSTYLDNETARSIYDKNRKSINELANANLVGWNGAERSEKLKKMLEPQKDFTAILIKTMLCIFEVRNRLLHRGEELSLIPLCNPLLKNLVTKILIRIVETSAC